MEYENVVADLYREHATGILRMCYLYLNDYHMAEDAMQETFVKVFRNYGKFKGNSYVKTWITRIAINVCKDIISDKADELMWKDDFDEKADENRYGHIENKMMLTGAIARLEEKLKVIIILFYYQELSTKEISKILDIPRTTVEFRLKQARRVFQASHLKDYITVFIDTGCLFIYYKLERKI